MRILFAVHYYLPRHQAGTELYTRALAREFQRQGHQVFIFTSEDQSQPGFNLKTDEDEGVKVFRLYHPGAIDFKSGYSRPEFDQVFGRVLDELKPDLVHFQHLLRLSSGFVSEAGQRKIPSVLTLADYWMICPAIIMLRPEDQVCPGEDLEKACANCPHSFSAFYPGEASAEKAGVYRLAESGLAYAHKLKRQLPPGWVDWLREKIGKKAELEQRQALLKERWEAIRKTVDQLSLLIAPSRFLMEMMIKSGMAPREKIIYSDYGFEAEKFQPDRPSAMVSRSSLSLGFIGTLVRHKGVHLLLKAIRMIPDQNLELRIFGEEKDFPGYVRMLKKIAGRDQRIKWMGKIKNDRISEALGQIDVLVVPSLWYENSPLTIHEAFLAKVPVLAGNLGGMAELVQEGRGGILFEPNHPSDLAEKIRDLLKHPDRLTSLKACIPEVKTIGRNCRELLEIYQKLVH